MSLIITITGPQASGKTVMAGVIERHLNSLGIIPKCYDGAFACPAGFQGFIPKMIDAREVVIRTEVTRQKKVYDRIQLSVDGNAGMALLGENIQEGECEFVDVEQLEDEFLHDAEVRACWQAFQRLKERLGRPELSYFWHSRRPGAAGA